MRLIGMAGEVWISISPAPFFGQFTGQQQGGRISSWLRASRFDVTRLAWATTSLLKSLALGSAAHSAAAECDVQRGEAQRLFHRTRFVGRSGGIRERRFRMCPRSSVGVLNLVGANPVYLLRGRCCVGKEI